MSVADYLLWALRTAAAGALGYVLLTMYRAIRERSTALANMVALRIVLRAVIGVALFWVSYLHVPVASSLQLGGGFWALAPDAGGYFERAAQAASTLTPVPIALATPSPVYLNVLALAMWLFGTSPATGMFLNLALYVSLMAAIARCAVLVDDWRDDAAALACAAAYSFSPVIVFHSTQPLKDELSATLIAAGCLGTLGMAGLVYRSIDRRWPTALAGGAALTVAMFGAGGVRWYFGPLMWASLAVVVVVFAFVGRTRPLGEYLRGAALLLSASAVAVLAAGWPQLAHAVNLDAPRVDVADAGSAAIETADVARAGFVRSGGGTNIEVPTANRVDTTAIGLLVVFAPTAVVQAVTHVQIPRGRGLLALADIDTVFFDVTLAALAILVWRHRRSLEQAKPFLCFALVLSATTAVLPGYVVTNYGTMFRMRLLVAVPLWVIGVGVTLAAPRMHAARSADDTRTYAATAGRQRSGVTSMAAAVNPSR